MNTKSIRYPIKHPFFLAIAFVLISCGKDENSIQEFSATLSVSATTMAVAEDVGTASFTFTLNKTNLSGAVLSIPFTLSGTASSLDYSSQSLVAEIEEDATTTTVSLAITDDSEVEDNETIILTLGTLPSGLSASSNSATITIQDNDTEAFSAIASITASSTTVTEDAGSVTYTISLDKENTSGGALTIPLSLSGTATISEDFTPSAPPEVSIANGATSATFELGITDDEEVEESETIVLSFGTLPDVLLAGSENVTVTIEDNDVAPFEAIISIAATASTVSEEVGTATFTITLSTANTSGSVVTIPFEITGTATATEDFTEPTLTVDIANNETSATIDILIIDDATEESDETIIVTLGTLPEGITSSTNSATLTINDNDNTGSDITISFGTATGNTIAITGWTDIGADTYIVLINNQSSFSSLSATSSLLASDTYVGYGEQVIYNGNSSSALSVSLLQYSFDYSFKVVPVTGGVYDNSQSVFTMGTDGCVTTSTSVAQVCFEIDETGDTRTISSNQYPSHEVGNFPNADPTATQITRILDLTPSYSGTPIYLYSETGGPTPSNDNFYKFGMASNGVEFHPMGLQPFTNPDTGEENWEWQAKVTEQGEINLDAWGAHVTTAGNYHYHGDIVGLVDEDGVTHSAIYGFAADGFPIYYKYGYSNPDDPTSAIIELQSSYQMKSGTRPGDGTTAPNGSYDGTYIQDFEYVSGLGNLDECNGRTGITPEYPNGTYYYVITSEFPVVSNCFYGSPAEDWKIGR